MDENVYKKRLLFFGSLTPVHKWCFFELILDFIACSMVFITLFYLASILHFASLLTWHEMMIFNFSGIFFHFGVILVCRKYFWIFFSSTLLFYFIIFLTVCDAIVCNGVQVHPMRIFFFFSELFYFPYLSTTCWYRKSFQKILCLILPVCIDRLNVVRNHLFYLIRSLSKPTLLWSLQCDDALICFVRLSQFLGSIHKL